MPLLLLLYGVIRSVRWRNGLLLLSGFLFYAFGSLQGLLILLLFSIVNYLLDMLLLRIPSGTPSRKWVLTLGVAGNLLFLVIYQYLDFLLGEVLHLSHGNLGLAAPLGISFFTFKAISCLVDLARGKIERFSFFDFLLYLSFFPQVLAGPITRFAPFQAQLQKREKGEIADGLRRFVCGLGKKLIFAGLLSQTANGVFDLDPAALDIRLAWLGAISYMLQIYFDFSGYSDMAIGLGQMFGFCTEENFRHPYIAASLKDFWSRWHISLTSWFRDYLYIPLGGNRKGTVRTAVNKFLVFLMSGLWHGASWTYLIWGAWHGLFSGLESSSILKPDKWRIKCLRHLYTLLVVCLGFVFFRSATLSQALHILGAMFTGFSFTAAGTVALHTLLTPAAIVLLLLGAVCCLPWSVYFRKNPAVYKKLEPFSYLGALAVFLFCLLRLAAGGFSPFIYTQF